MKREYTFLDLLRFIGAIVVMAYHVPLKLGLYINLPFIFRDGYLWVFYFFMISGFFSANSYRGQTINLMKFMKRKVSKVYPLYFLSLIIVYSSINKPIEITEYVASLFLIQTWLLMYLPYSDPGWYLSTLLFLYLCFPFVIKRAYKNKLRFLFATIAIIIITTIFIDKIHSFYISSGGIRKELNYLIRYSPVVMFGVFFTGISINLFTRDLPKSKYYSFLIIIVLLIQSVLITKTSYLTNILVFIPIVLFSSLDSGFLSKITNNSFVSFLSNLSFPIYILHMPISYLMRKVFDTSLLSNKSVLVYYFTVLLISIFILASKKIIKSYRNANSVE